MGSIHKNRIHPCSIIASAKFHFESVMFSVYTTTPGSPVLPVWSGLVVPATFIRRFKTTFFANRTHQFFPKDQA